MTRMSAGQRLEYSHETFPTRSLAGDLLGVTGEGHGVYATETTVEVGARDGGWQTYETHVVTRLVLASGTHEDFEEVLCPPPEETFDSARVDLGTGDRTLAEYIFEMAVDAGRWESLSDWGRDVLLEAGYNPTMVLQNT